ncbi:MAG: hypothetical protein P4L57_05170 [Rhizomicrobium sp.]|nr:hypothetical protein [Rhizomicrobium sp.]
MIYRYAAVVAASVLLSGCATVFEGTHQDIQVVTNPPGASCVLERQGAAIATVPQTPGTASVRKLKYDIMIKCDKAGYQQAQYLNHSGTTALIAANVAADIILTLGVSSIVDSANGADNKYDSAVNISMVPVAPAAPLAAAAPAPSVTAPSSDSPAKPSL